MRMAGSVWRRIIATTFGILPGYVKNYGES